MDFARAWMEGEEVMHELMFARFRTGASALPSKVTAAYNAHIEAAIRTGCKEVAFASLLPCIWIYNEVGKFLKSIAASEGNPYCEWIDEYGNEDFSASVETILSMINEYADGADERIRAEMTCQFRDGVRYEYEFWDYAYRGE